MVKTLMNDSAQIRSLSVLLSDLKQEPRGDTVSVRALAEALHERGIAMLQLLFAAPMALPLPEPPIVNLVLGLPLVLLTAQQAMGAHAIWLPRKILDLTVSREKLNRMLDALIPWMKRLEIFIRPRLGALTQGALSRLWGACGFLIALAILIPVPLFHTVPSLGITLMAAGISMRDGVVIILGALIGMGWIIILTTAIFMFGPDAVDIVREMIKSIS